MPETVAFQRADISEDLVRTTRLMDACNDQIKHIERLIEIWDDVMGQEQASGGIPGAPGGGEYPNTAERQQELDHALGLLAELRFLLQLNLRTKAELQAALIDLRGELRAQGQE
ncbi:hypothetical protein BX616_011356 [Lobosporangium transversale]|uniref:Uncharacterized protein n=1 Tax=Lobosporangium transversale TaxID=64571 RepID=A0A1Y2GYB3_9FUNG|nr:hypothetical protein BCR41DRAFT_392623 [Lobosporangium transversale]KAF9917765.1 hypothetical protein BX616_011356 [Lobosporangium transversale]ORZ27298.1 hypothetical protein BCR41DRAFT_392623 [Lobosporangium transversale]|eukprot:XP_021885025.1 hypothetical protein BCR41DRAFT_392623 [Lobosporangium transversale]